MKQLVWLLGILVLSQISGCASLLTSTGNADDQIDRWLSQQEYGKAAGPGSRPESNHPPPRSVIFRKRKRRSTSK